VHGSCLPSYHAWYLGYVPVTLHFVVVLLQFPVTVLQHSCGFALKLYDLYVFNYCVIMFLHSFLSRMFIASESCPPVTLLLVMLNRTVLFSSSFVHPKRHVLHSESELYV